MAGELARVRSGRVGGGRGIGACAERVDVGVVLLGGERRDNVLVGPRLALGEEGADGPQGAALRHEDVAAWRLCALGRAAGELLLPGCLWLQGHTDRALRAELEGLLDAVLVLARVGLADGLGRHEAEAWLGRRDGGRGRRRKGRQRGHGQPGEARLGVVALLPRRPRQV